MAAFLNKEYKTKKKVREALANGEKIKAIEPTPWKMEPVSNAKGLAIVGPSASNRKWYGQVDIEEGLVVRIK